jgi:hypothetical protein
MTNEEIVQAIVDQSSMGYVPVDLVVTMPVTLYNVDGTPVVENRQFHVSAISLVREDISEVKTVVTNEDIPNPNVEKTPAVTIADIPLKEKDIEEGE